jgi:nucleotidyltransferase substrate binding protein (TIGR01987 family)
MKIKNILIQVSSIVADELMGDYQLFLFGSRAKDINDDKSDVDIGIISEHRITGKQWLSIQEKLENIQTLLKIDLVDFDSVTGDFRPPLNIPGTLKMTSDKLGNSTALLKKAIDRFAEALDEPETSIVMDATIQRFEFTYELLGKTLKTFLEDVHGVRTVSPRQVFKEAYALSLIEEENIFLEMIKSRNLLSHTYNEEQAADIYQKCPSYLSATKNVYHQICKNRPGPDSE